MPWYQSKYAKAALVALCTGAIAAVIMNLGIVDDLSLTTRQVVKIVGLSFMAPFATLIRFLPSFETIFNQPQPQQIVRTDNIESVTVERPATPEPSSPPPAPVIAHRIVTTTPPRTASGRFDRKGPVPPVPPLPVDVTADH